MSVHLECERCGQQEQTADVMVLARTIGPGLPTVRPELPDGWTRPQLPTEDGELRYKELCPGCKADLLAFMRGLAVPGGTLVAASVAVDVPKGLDVRVLELPHLPADKSEAVCPTCGPVPLEPHPRLPVQRCSNCKEHLGTTIMKEGNGGD